MKTKREILDEIEILESVMHRENLATANMAELRRDELSEIASTMQDNQLADCGHLFWC